MVIPPLSYLTLVFRHESHSVDTTRGAVSAPSTQRSVSLDDMAWTNVSERNEWRASGPGVPFVRLGESVMLHTLSIIKLFVEYRVNLMSGMQICWISPFIDSPVVHRKRHIQMTISIRSLLCRGILVRTAMWARVRWGSVAGGALAKPASHPCSFRPWHFESGTAPREFRFQVQPKFGTYKQPTQKLRRLQ